MAVVDYTALVHTGPDTLAGRYLRQFWQPVYRVQDLAAGQAVPIRILNEDFTLYRGGSGTPHVVGFRCAHRGTQLSSGWVEGDCIRCLYHGWKYDGTGQCVEQPGEGTSFAAKVRIRSYPTREYLGLVFAYLGDGEPEPFRGHPDFERDFLLEVGRPEYWPCNYFNRLDNDGDAGHVPFTHRESIGRTGQPQRLAIPAVSAEEMEYGIRHTVVAVGRPPMFVYNFLPNILQVRARTSIEGSMADAVSLWEDRLVWTVPVDDTNSVRFDVNLVHLRGEAAQAYQARHRQAATSADGSAPEAGEAILAGRLRLKDLDPDLSMYKLFRIEDYATQVGIGCIADRSQGAERLGRVDVGVILLRKVWLRELRALAEGRPLKQWSPPPPGLADASVMAAPAVPVES